MNEVTRWVLGVLFTLILGSYGYTLTIAVNDSNERQQLENRVIRQLDLIERKIDRVLEQQYNDRKR